MRLRPWREIQTGLLVFFGGAAIFFFALWQGEKAYGTYDGGDFWEQEYRIAHSQALRAVELGEKCADLLEQERKITNDLRRRG